MAKLDYEKKNRQEKVKTYYKTYTPKLEHKYTELEVALMEWLETGCSKHRRKTPNALDVVKATRGKVLVSWKQALKIAVENPKVKDIDVLRYAVGCYKRLEAK